MPAPRLSKAVASVSAAAVLLSTLFALPAAAAQGPAIDSRPVSPPSTTKATPPSEASSRFVVKFKTGAPGAATARAKAYGQAARTSGIPVKELRTTATGGTVVVQASETLTPSESASVVASLRGQTNVEYAEQDTFVRPAATASDPLYQYQWDLSDEKAGMRVPAAWEVTSGLGTVVAVIDTGITPHSDLSANIVPGYDFISDASLSNDGDGRDADSTDAGDYCNGAASSWHGTHVAGTIAAVANNGRGVAGVAYGAKVQPLRALGSCGGYLSDIADAVVWAAGGAVSGLAANATPAKVINMSLGGSGQCSVYFQSALDFAAAQGVAVVAAAGNENSPTSGSTPANCDKIITVGATGRTGSRAFYSNYGPEVDVSAPGGDASTSGYDAILSTWNDGQTTAGTEAYGFMQGTSMAAPHAAAVAALMMTAGSTVTPADVEAKLKSTARALPGSCDTGGCGAGLVDAGAAVRASMPAATTVTAGSPTITGSVRVGGTLTALEGEWTPGDVSFTYQWLRNGNPISDANQRTYQINSSEVGSVFLVTVTGSKPGLNPVAATSGYVGPVPVPTVAGTPVISGSTVVGATLTADPGTWSPGPVSFTYKWLRNGLWIPTLSLPTYVLQAADLGATIKVQVSGFSTYFQGTTVVSAATGTVTEGTLTASPAPTISGTAAVGLTVTAVPGASDPGTAVTYQWRRAGTPIAGATAAAYTLQSADLGQTISVQVTRTKPGYTPITLESDPTSSVQTGTLEGPAPTLAAQWTSGPVHTYDVISADFDTSKWTPGTSFQKQWYRSGVPIPGASILQYEAFSADVGETLTFRVVASKAGYASVVLETSATATVRPRPIILGTPVISGTAKVGYTLTSNLPEVITPGKMGPMSPPYQFQWYRSGIAVAAATAQRYTLAAADLGKAISVRVTVDLTYGWEKQTQSSAPTVAVAAGTLTAPIPTVSGTKKVGYALTAAPGSWTAGTTLKYQWYRSGVAIIGATASKYALGSADLGKTMKVRVTGSKAGYTTLAKDSASTTAVVAGTLTAPNPWISGTPRYGYTLTANTGSWTAGTTLRYQWYRSGVAIAGATGKWYRLVAADRYDTIKIRVVGSKAGYTTVTRYSGPTVRIP
jgi:serine protease